MKTYYYDDGTAITQAWSEMECERAQLEQVHIPHWHDPEFTIYGPYICPGWNGQSHYPIYDQPVRKPVSTRHTRRSNANRTEV